MSVYKNLGGETKLSTVVLARGRKRGRRIILGYVMDSRPGSIKPVIVSINCQIDIAQNHLGKKKGNIPIELCE